MKKHLIIYLLLITIILTGCNNNKETIETIEFTEDIINPSNTISYKLPKDHETNYSFQDNGVNVIFSIDQLKDDDSKLKEYDKFAYNIEEKTINGRKYEYYRFKYTKDWIMYIYRTKGENNTTYQFILNAYASEYDDDHIEQFMNTVKFL